MVVLKLHSPFERETFYFKEKKVCEGVKTAQAVHSDEDNRSEQKLREEEIAGQNKNIRSSIPSHGVPLVEKECLKKNLTRVAKNGAVKRESCAHKRESGQKQISKMQKNFARALQSLSSLHLQQFG